MRARWDNSKLDHVRTKVQRLKKSLFLAERKLREAREILSHVVTPDFKRAFGGDGQVNRYMLADGLVFKPLRTVALGTYSLESFWQGNENNPRYLDKDTTICKRNKDFSSQEGTILRTSASLEGIRDESSCRDDTLVRSPIHRLTLKVFTAREKTAALRNQRETMHGKIGVLQDMILKIQTRTHDSEETFKILHGRMEAIQSRLEILKQKVQARKQSEMRICRLVNGINFGTQRAIVAETREGELETRVLELEDSLEEYDIKIHRAQNVLCRMTSFSKGDDSPGKESCSITMVLRRVSLTRQSSSASFKGQIPLILDSCGEESDISDQAFE